MITPRGFARWYLEHEELRCSSRNEREDLLTRITEERDRAVLREHREQAATYRAGTGEPGGTRALLMWEAVDRELQAIRQHEANPTRGGQHVGDGPKWLGLVRAPFVRQELEWYAREALTAKEPT